MSGGAWEYTAAYINNGNGNLGTYGGNLIGADVKYKDVYTSSGDTQAGNYAAASNKKGDAAYEISSTINGSYSWYSDYAYMPYSSNPFLVRGGACNIATSSGEFAFSYYYGSAYFYLGFRPIIVLSGSF